MSVLLWVLCIPLVAYLIFKIFWTILRNRTIRTTTILFDLDKLALHPRQPDKKVQGAAVIAGGSLAGFLTARILVDYFEQVIIIEPDPSADVHSVSRIPQRPYIHAYGAIVLETLRRLFPHFNDEARKEKAMVSNGWYRWTIGGYQTFPKPNQIADQLVTSRPITESLVRRLAKDYAQNSLQIIQGTVVGVQSSSDGSRIESISYRTSVDTDSPSTPIQSLSTSFFVDCSGPTSISAKILPVAGASWGPYPRYQYNPNVLYRTGTIHVSDPIVREALSRTVPIEDPDYGSWDRITIFDAFAPVPQVVDEFYAIQKVDGDKLLLGHCGWGAEDLSNNFSQFVEAVHTIRNRTLHANPSGKKQSRWIFDFLKTLGDSIDNIDDVKFAKYKMGPCRWIDFEAATFPDNFAAIGDTRMNLNPTFGQGLSKILAEITVLNSILSEEIPSSGSITTVPSLVSRRFFPRARQVTHGMWDLNRMIDYGYNSTIPQEGTTLTYGETFRRFWFDLLGVCEKDNYAAVAHSNVMGGLAPGIDLGHPYILFRVYLSRLWSRQ